MWWLELEIILYIHVFALNLYLILFNKLIGKFAYSTTKYFLFILCWYDFKTVIKNLNNCNFFVYLLTLKVTISILWWCELWLLNITKCVIIAVVTAVYFWHDFQIEFNIVYIILIAIKIVMMYIHTRYAGWGRRS